MSLRRIKRKVRQYKNKIRIAVGILVVAALVAFFLASVKMPTFEKSYELTKVDVLSIKGVKGNQVTLKGIGLGSTQQQALDAIGFPDTQTFYPPDITNIEFGKAFGLNETGAILQFKEDALEKITLTKAFNELLHGKTKLQYFKDEFLITFGKPDQVKQIPLTEGSPIVIRVYTYNEGIQFTTRRSEQIALSFIGQI